MRLIDRAKNAKHRIELRRAALRWRKQTWPVKAESSVLVVVLILQVIVLFLMNPFFGGKKNDPKNPT